MIVLGMDTSTMTGGAALVGPKGLVGESVLNIRSTHSERLLPAVERLLDDAEVTLDDVDGFAVASGPGSFTGLRIGMATAKGFAYALGRPLIGVTVLEALAYQFMAVGTVVLPLIDARRGQVYAQPFSGQDAMAEPQNCHIDDVIVWGLEQRRPIVFCGDGASVYQDVLAEKLPDAVFPPLEQRALRSASVAGLGRQRLLAGQRHEPMELVPFYLRKSEAEMKWDAKN